MSNAPERIKVEPAGDWSDLWDASDEKRTGTGAEVLYVRADIHDAVIAARDRLRADLDAQIEWFWLCPTPMTLDQVPFSPGNFGRKLGSTPRALPPVSDKSAKAVSMLEAHGWRWEHGGWQPPEK